MALKVSATAQRTNGGWHAVATATWRRQGVIPEGFRAEADGHTEDEAKSNAETDLRAKKRFQFADAHA